MSRRPYRRRKYRSQRRQIVGEHPGVLPSFEEYFCRDELYLTYAQLLRKSQVASRGTAEAIWRDEIDPTAGSVVEVKSIAVLAGRYQPDRSRKVRIPKSRPGEYRVLTIPSIFDRAVSAHLQQALASVFDPMFSPRSHGFRPRRSPISLLRGVESDVVVRQCRWIAVDDLVTAFDNIRVEDIMRVAETVVKAHTPSHDDATRYLGLMSVILAGNTPRRTGIGQGDPMSPLGMNVLLHAIHDDPLNRSGKAWHRYADNLVYLGQDKTEVENMVARTRHELGIYGLTTHGATIADLSAGESVELLGFRVRGVPDGISLHLGANALQRLGDHLRDAHDSPHPTAAARNAVRGWATYYGLAYETDGALTDSILSKAAEWGYREIDPAPIREAWRTSCNRWHHGEEDMDAPR